MLMAVCDFCNKMKYTDRVAPTAVGLINSRLSIILGCVYVHVCLLKNSTIANYMYNVPHHVHHEAAFVVCCILYDEMIQY